MKHLSKETLQRLVTQLSKLMYEITEDQYREAFGVRTASTDSLERRFTQAAEIFNELNGE